MTTEEEDAAKATKEAEDKKIADESAEKKRVEDLEAENKKLKDAAASTGFVQPAGQKIMTSEVMRNLPEEKWQEWEERNPGKRREDAIAFVAHMELKEQGDTIQARTNVEDAIGDAVTADAQVGKLRSGIKEYFKDVPASEKLNPERVKYHMERAKTYAKGKNPIPAPAKTGDPLLNSPKPGEDSDDDDDATKGKAPGLPGEVMEGVGMKITLPDTESSARLKKVQHPIDPNGVQFASKEEEPKFS